MVFGLFPCIVWINFMLLFASAVPLSEVSLSDAVLSADKAHKKARRARTKALLRTEAPNASIASLAEDAASVQATPAPSLGFTIRRRRNFHLPTDVIDLTTATVPFDTGLFNHLQNNAMCDNCGDVWYKIEHLLDGSGAGTDHNVWALVMKLSKNDFCFNSSKWTSHSAFDATRMKNPNLPPANGEYDGKSIAYYRLQGVRKIMIESQRSQTVTIEFSGTGTPKDLMTTDSVDLQYYPDFNDWRKTFTDDTGDFDYKNAPVFMRNGQAVLNPAPPCRNSNYPIQGSVASACTFCFYASKGDGSTCPTAGGSDDMTIGLGLAADGDVAGCSTDMTRDANSNWGDRTRLLVWAKVEAAELRTFEEAGNR